MSNTPPIEEEQMTNDQNDSPVQEAMSVEVNSTNSSKAAANSNNLSHHRGEMERRTEERLLDLDIRERYQREIGDIFDKEAKQTDAA